MPISMTPNGKPPTEPAGTAKDDSPKRLVELVNRPSRAFTPTGSEATSAIDGCPVVVGTSRASTVDRIARAEEANSASRARSEKSRCAGMSRAAEMIERTVGSTSAGCASMNAPTAVYRSATNAPSYSIRAASKNGSKSTGTTEAPNEETADENASSQPGANGPSSEGTPTRNGR